MWGALEIDQALRLPGRRPLGRPAPERFLELLSDVARPEASKHAIILRVSEASMQVNQSERHLKRMLAGFEPVADLPGAHG